MVLSITPPLEQLPLTTPSYIAPFLIPLWIAVLPLLRHTPSLLRHTPPMLDSTEPPGAQLEEKVPGLDGFHDHRHEFHHLLGDTVK